MPDGHRFVVIVQDPTDDDQGLSRVTFVLNVFDELRKPAACGLLADRWFVRVLASDAAVRRQDEHAVSLAAVILGQLQVDAGIKGRVESRPNLSQHTTGIFSRSILCLVD
jgi:hypothetical protein